LLRSITAVAGLILSVVAIAAAFALLSLAP
jgi:hypothetical protein